MEQGRWPDRRCRQSSGQSFVAVVIQSIHPMVDGSKLARFQPTIVCRKLAGNASIIKNAFQKEFQMLLSFATPQTYLDVWFQVYEAGNLMTVDVEPATETITVPRQPNSNQCSKEEDLLDLAHFSCQILLNQVTSKKIIRKNQYQQQLILRVSYIQQKNRR